MFISTLKFLHLQEFTSNKKGLLFLKTPADGLENRNISSANNHVQFFYVTLYYSLIQCLIQAKRDRFKIVRGLGSGLSLYWPKRANRTCNGEASNGSLALVGTLMK